MSDFESSDEPFTLEEMEALKERGRQMRKHVDPSLLGEATGDEYFERLLGLAHLINKIPEGVDGEELRKKMEVAELEIRAESVERDLGRRAWKFAHPEDTKD